MAARLVQFLANPLPLQLGQIIHEQLAIEMIDFMLDTDGQQTVGFRLDSGNRGEILP